MRDEERPSTKETEGRPGLTIVTAYSMRLHHSAEQGLREPEGKGARWAVAAAGIT